jgi:hypothetical protein
MQSSIKVVVGIPLAPDNLVDSRLSRIVENMGDGVEVIYSATHSPALGRDKIVQQALYQIPRPSHILFVDSDVVIRRNTLSRLLSHDKDIVCGVAPLCIRGELVWNCSRSSDFKSFDGVKINALPDDIFKATKIGFGCVLIKTEVFDKMKWPYWKFEYREGDIVTGEDIYFGYKAVKSGFDLWIDPKVKCEHNKNVGLLGIMKG